MPIAFAFSGAADSFLEQGRSYFFQLPLHLTRPSRFIPLPHLFILISLNPQVDLLRRKIASGVRIARHVTSFGDRSNDIETVCKCGCLFYQDVLYVFLIPAVRTWRPTFHTSHYLYSFPVYSLHPLTLNSPDFKQKFREIQRQNSSEPRHYYGYFTSVTVCVCVMRLLELFCHVV